MPGITSLDIWLKPNCLLSLTMKIPYLCGRRGERSYPCLLGLGKMLHITSRRCVRPCSFRSSFISYRDLRSLQMSSPSKVYFIENFLCPRTSQVIPFLFSDLREVMGEEASLNRLIRPLLLSKPLPLSPENDIPPSISQLSDAWASERFYSPQSTPSTQTVGLFAFGSFILAHLGLFLCG